MEGILDFVGFMINVGYLFLFSGCDVNWGWVGGWETKGFISGQFYSNSVTFANSIHVGKANSESSLCSVFIVKFDVGISWVFCFYQIPWVLLSTWIHSLSSLVYLNSWLLGDDCQLIVFGIFTGMQDWERRGPENWF